MVDESKQGAGLQECRELLNPLRRQWNNIPARLIQNLFESFRARLQTPVEVQRHHLHGHSKRVDELHQTGFNQPHQVFSRPRPLDRWSHNPKRNLRYQRNRTIHGHPTRHTVQMVRAILIPSKDPVNDKHGVFTWRTVLASGSCAGECVNFRTMKIGKIGSRQTTLAPILLYSGATLQIVESLSDDGIITIVLSCPEVKSVVKQ
jgi:hypothetical protein